MLSALRQPSPLPALGERPALDRHQRARIEAAIEMLLGILDAADADPDAEPYLGAPENHPCPAGFNYSSQEHLAAFLADESGGRRRL